MNIKLKDIAHLFNANVEVFYKGNHVNYLEELAQDHWIFWCNIKSIEAEKYDKILIDTF
jgi:hypothetical protein